jgi:hypothetical protein
VAPPVFKTGERRSASLAGSIPVRLRHSAAGSLLAPPDPVGRAAALDELHRLDALLSQWREHLAGVPGAGEDGTAAALRHEAAARLTAVLEPAGLPAAVD